MKLILPSKTLDEKINTCCVERDRANTNDFLGQWSLRVSHAIFMIRPIRLVFSRLLLALHWQKIYEFMNILHRLGSFKVQIASSKLSNFFSEKICRQCNNR
jgi:hypothetical protein